MPPPRFLIDENLSVALPALAHAAGFECQHVNELGLRTKDDAILMERIIAHDWTLVTNNWREFLARFSANAPLHAGLLLLVAANGIEEQTLAFKLALLAVLQQNIDLTNVALFVERKGNRLEVRSEPWPV